MSLLSTEKVYPSAYDLAKDISNNMRTLFDTLYTLAKKDHDEFWYANGKLEGPKPTGVQILQALGDKAQHVIYAFKARIDLLQALAASQGLSSTVEWNAIMPPYEFKWNEDGSLGQAILK